MTRAPRYTQTVANLPATVPFIGPEAMQRSAGKPFATRLGANESVYGPSPRVIDAIAAAGPDVWMYGDAEAFDLRNALAKHHNLAIDNIVVGSGIDGLLGTVIRLLVAPGDPVVTSAGAYPTFAYHVAANGGTLHTVPYSGDHEDPKALVAKARETRAKIVYIANPDNPMGSWHSAATIQDMIKDLPDDCVLALDEAYIDLAPAGAAPLFDMGDPRILRFRTFSKAHGLAGLRVGYAIGAATTIRMFDTIRDHFGVGRLAQSAALAAVQDVEWLRQVKAKVATARTELSAIASENGLAALPSATNFVTIDCGRDGAFARAVLSGLLARGIFARMPGVAPLDRCIRVSCGRADDHALFATALSETLRELGNADVT
ncbi:pyridoxal phosphate-dependent aminotransferase [Meridianimarinicoccus aquatilis]|uniref:Pyridoxal phosphate-dependent aminotransferase n=1 Tax=Meridianimarinicoccus aquatilis TaxID=2552766 RepID=A0A4R6AXS5_9RHOB|nr:pyridoxal phosphate-dependent aminotransferase [Fluviibacterium aquatile]TDL89037.1 pyridoxal phosphate-dependent aminotransferase [Fluviibacterium aquatile]